MTAADQPGAYAEDRLAVLPGHRGQRQDLDRYDEHADLDAAEQQVEQCPLPMVKGD